RVLFRSDLDAGGLLETGQGVGGSVFSPAVDVDDAILGGRRNRGDQRGGGQQGVNGADSHGMGSYHGGKQRDNASHHCAPRAPATFTKDRRSRNRFVFACSGDTTPRRAGTNAMIQTRSSASKSMLYAFRPACETPAARSASMARATAAGSALSRRLDRA